MSVEILASMLTNTAGPLVGSANQMISQAVGQAVGRMFLKQPVPAATVDQVKLLLNQYQGSKQTYLESQPDLNAVLEQRRSELLKRMTAAQNRIPFEVQDPELIARIVPFVIEQTTALYNVTTDAQFAPIELGITQIDAILTINAEAIVSRSAHRIWAIGFTLTILGALVALIGIGYAVGLTAQTNIPIVDIPLPVIIWSIIGSLGAMLYRFNSSADAELADPLRWSFTRPLTGILMGIVAYMVFKAGVAVLQTGGTNTSSQAVAADAPDTLLWLAAFLAGFSDRFADTVIRGLTGRLGGDRSGELVTAAAAVSTSSTRMNGLLSLLSSKSAVKLDAPIVQDNAVAQPAVNAKPEKAKTATQTAAVAQQDSRVTGEMPLIVTPDSLFHSSSEPPGQEQNLDAVARTSIPSGGNANGATTATKLE